MGDQPTTIGALTVALAQAMGVAVAHPSGLAMRRIADLYPDNARTDQCDAFIISQAARTMSHALRTLRARDWQALSEDILNALATQTVTVTNAAANVIPHLAATLNELYRQRADIEEQIEELASQHPL